MLTQVLKAGVFNGLDGGNDSGAGRLAARSPL